MLMFQIEEFIHIPNTQIIHETETTTNYFSIVFINWWQRFFIFLFTKSYQICFLTSGKEPRNKETFFPDENPEFK